MTMLSQNKEQAVAAVSQLVTRFDPITLRDMKQVALLKRTDTKFVLSVEQLCHALAQLASRYRVLDIEGRRLHRYQTLYFDTEHFTLYRQHHNGGLNRHKVRYRKYLDSGLCYLEVKFKDSRQRTIKNRIPAEGRADQLTGRAADFVQRHFPIDPSAVEPKLWNQFWRITLVSKFRPERLTIDLDVNLYHQYQKLAWPGVVVAEVKQPKFTLASDFVQAMKERQVQSRGFSKYCMGVSMLYPQQVPGNNFKSNQLLVQKLVRGGRNYDRIH